MAMKRPALAHLGIFVIDIDLMEQFYRDAFGLVVTDRGVGAVFKNMLVFMSGSEEQHHQIVLSTGREPGTKSTIMQLSFKVSTIDDLRDVVTRAEKNGAGDMICLNHGNALSAYFNDPEENRIEVYLDTDFHTPQPCAHPFDLSDPDATIMAQTRELVGKLPGSMPRQEYVASMARVLAED